MRRFEGQTALVTGGAKGIGAATAERLASEGAHVVVADFDEAAATGTAKRIGGRLCAATSPRAPTSRRPSPRRRRTGGSTCSSRVPGSSATTSSTSSPTTTGSR